MMKAIYSINVNKFNEDGEMISSYTETFLYTSLKKAVAELQDRKDTYEKFCKDVCLEGEKESTNLWADDGTIRTYYHIDRKYLK